MKPYSKEVAEKIIGERICEFDVSDDGIRPRLVSVENAEFDQLINWSPLCELDDDDGPNPEIAPALPFPFAANHLAAWMVHGGGYFVREQYGDWSDGPDPQSILKLGVQATKAKQALKRAFDAYRSAANIVGPCDTTYSEKIQQLEKQYGAWPDAQDARDKIKQVHREADAYEAAWRKKIVHQLLAVVVEPAPQAAPAQQADVFAAPVTEIEAAGSLPDAPVVEATISRLPARRVDALAGLIEDAELMIGAGADVASISTALFQWAIDDKKPGRLLPDTKGDVLRFTNGRHQEQITESALKQRIRRYLNRQDS